MAYKLLDMALARWRRLDGAQSPTAEAALVHGTPAICTTPPTLTTDGSETPL